MLNGWTRVIDDAPDIEMNTVTDSASGTAVDEPVVARRSLEVGTRHAEQWIDGSFTHQGRTLAYKLYVPPSAGEVPIASRPMVVMLHGCTQEAADFAAGTQMNALARDLGVVVL